MTKYYFPFLLFFVSLSVLAGFSFSNVFATEYDFNGTTSVFRITTTGAIETSILTIGCWTKREGAGETNARIYNKFSTTGTGLYYNGTNYEFNAQFPTTDGIWTVTPPAQDVIAHIAVAYDSSLTTNDPDIFIDGVLQSETKASTPVGIHNPGAFDLTFGNAGGTANTWDGKLSDCFYYNRKLTANEIKQIMYFGPESVGNGLIGYWPMGTFGSKNLTTTPSLDASTNSNTTVSNTGPPRITPQGTGLLGWE